MFFTSSFVQHTYGQSVCMSVPSHTALVTVATKFPAADVDVSTYSNEWQAEKEKGVV